LDRKDNCSKLSNWFSKR